MLPENDVRRALFLLWLGVTIAHSSEVNADPREEQFRVKINVTLTVFNEMVPELATGEDCVKPSFDLEEACEISFRMCLHHGDGTKECINFGTYDRATVLFGDYMWSLDHAVAYNNPYSFNVENYEEGCLLVVEALSGGALMTRFAYGLGPSTFPISSTASVPRYSGREGSRNLLGTYVLVSCQPSFYGPECLVYCKNHDDDSNGHYKCDENGNKVCLEGYTDQNSDCKVAKETTPAPEITTTNQSEVTTPENEDTTTQTDVTTQANEDTTNQPEVTTPESEDNATITEVIMTQTITKIDKTYSVETKPNGATIETEIIMTSSEETTTKPQNEGKATKVAVTTTKTKNTKSVITTPTSDDVTIKTLVITTTEKTIKPEATATSETSTTPSAEDSLAFQSHAAMTQNGRKWRKFGPRLRLHRSAA